MGPSGQTHRRWLRQTDRVCDSCQKKLDAYDLSVERAREPGGEQVVRWNGPDGRWDGLWPTSRRELESALNELVLSVGKPTMGDGEPLSQFQNPGSRARRMMMGREFVTAYRDLERLLRAAFQESHTDGFRRGHALLTGLADGSMSTADFEAKVDRGV